MSGPGKKHEENYLIANLFRNSFVEKFFIIQVLIISKLVANVRAGKIRGNLRIISIMFSMFKIAFCMLSCVLPTYAVYSHFILM